MVQSLNHQHIRGSFDAQQLPFLLGCDLTETGTFLEAASASFPFRTCIT